mmetsp:Transcript_38336/g.53221  ORF Transcript_38336/g.53221 Transcript_38336/m.53221 type:complete len:125 (+) Transcript_38336:88-462(+)
MSRYDAAAEERRLRPLYDAIGTHNYKAAMKLSDQLLKKQPKSHLVRILKSLTLERIGRRSEALELITTVSVEVPTDEHVLNTMCLVYKGLGMLEAFVAVKNDERSLDSLELQNTFQILLPSLRA